MRWWVFLLPAVVPAWSCAAPREAAPEFRVEKHAIAGGAEILTVFARVSAAGVRAPDNQDDDEVPLLSVLRDTLGDQTDANDRLRYVWVLTSARPTLLQRAAAAIPFFYWRAGFAKNADKRPVPVLDLGAPRRTVWTALTGSLTQALAFDPNGALIRSSTRSYRNNAHDQRQLHLLEGLGVLSQLEDLPSVTALLSEPELLAMQARLALAGQTFGGLVGDSKLPEAYMNQRTRAVEERGHNWELLRQRAESNGLYFEPFGPSAMGTQALLWVAKEDLIGAPREFDSQFLGISDPYRDARLRNWTGYAETRYLDAEGRPATADFPGARSVDLIPLALYSLEYPKVPLLLVDFRSTYAPKHREMARHAAVDVVSGVLGISKFGNWPYFAGSATWNFVRARHGAADSRSARLKGYSQVRQWLALDHSLDPAFRADLRKRLELLGINPLDDNVFDQAKFAQHQYRALLRYADDPQGLSARLDRSRSFEERQTARRGMSTSGDAAQ
jgi:hypothetical protein